MKPKPWDILTDDEQNLYLTLLWEDGHSEKAIADFLGTTKGRIVRRRQTTLKLPTEGRPVSKSEVNPERFRDLLDLYEMGKLEEQGVAVVMPQERSDEEPQGPRETEVTTCGWPLATSRGRKPTLCGKLVVPGHSVCEEHLAQIPGAKR